MNLGNDSSKVSWQKLDWQWGFRGNCVLWWAWSRHCYGINEWHCNIEVCRVQEHLSEVPRYQGRNGDLFIRVVSNFCSAKETEQHILAHLYCGRLSLAWMHVFLGILKPLQRALQSFIFKQEAWYSFCLIPSISAICDVLPGIHNSWAIISWTRSSRSY